MDVFWGSSLVTGKAVALLGFGAIGRALVQAYPSVGKNSWLKAIVVRPEQVAEVRQLVDMQVAVVDSVPHGVSLVLECAGHSAVAQHVLPALERGITVAMVSTGALADITLAQKLEQAALLGNTRLHILPGALAGLDALSAARNAGLQGVVYTGRKRPEAWVGSQAQHRIDLASIKAPTTLFSGSAREAAQRYPKNANVVATISLAGVGFDRTQVTLIADPLAEGNHHTVEAEGDFGRMQVSVCSRPLASNAKTSALTVWSAVRFLQSTQARIVI